MSASGAEFSAEGFATLQEAGDFAMNRRANGHDYGICADINMPVPPSGLQGLKDREIIQACDSRPLGGSRGHLAGQMRDYGAMRQARVAIL